MTDNLIYHEEDIIGYVKDIRKTASRYLEDDDVGDSASIILEALWYFDDGELVIMHYHPMGAYIVKRLVEEE